MARAPQSRALIGAVALWAIASATLPARVASAADPISLEVEGVRVIEGAGESALVLHINQPISSLSLELTTSDGRTIRRTLGPTPAGKELRVKLAPAVGLTRFDGSLAASFADGTKGDLPLSFEIEVLEPLQVDIEELDLKAGRATVVTNRPVVRCEHAVVAENKEEARGTTSFDDGAAVVRRPLALPIEPGDVVLKIHVRCFDASGSYAGVEKFPWWLEVPHEEVIFASGESRIEPTESEKVDRALEYIASAVRRYGAYISLRLYVIGHTDTVGAAAQNDRLSLARAKSVATYLRQRGVTIPIQYAGLGEKDPAVPTADEVDEPRNRRLQYVVAVNPPRPVAWQTLP